MTTIPDPTTTPAAPTAAPGERDRSPRVWVATVLVAVGALVLGLIGGWMLSSGGDDSTTWGGNVDASTLGEIDELLDDYWAAFDAGDGEAMVALMTADGWYSTDDTTVRGISGEDLVTYVETLAGVNFQRVGPPIVVENWAGFDVATAIRVDNGTENAEPGWALVHLEIHDEDGQLRVASYRLISTT
jgi:hypothetical protein